MDISQQISRTMQQTEQWNGDPIILRPSHPCLLYLPCSTFPLSGRVPCGFFPSLPSAIFPVNGSTRQIVYKNNHKSFHNSMRRSEATFFRIYNMATNRCSSNIIPDLSPGLISFPPLMFTEVIEAYSNVLYCFINVQNIFTVKGIKLFVK